MTNVRRIYIDSCGFIEMIKVEVGKQVASEREKDVWHMKKLLEANRDKEVEIFTSILTVAECTHVGEPDVSDEVKAAFTNILSSGQYVKLVQTTPFIGEDARDLRWRHGIRLRGADAIHVATALDRKCEELLTTNGRLQRLLSHEGALRNLGLRVGAGRTTTCLPDKYRQIEGFPENGKGKRGGHTTRGVH